jgi:hypothetical protein
MTEPADPASKTRVVPAPGSAPPEWAQELFQSIVDLRNQVAALRLGPNSPPAAPTYPPQLTPEALGLLGQDPRLPDFLKPLLPLLAYTVTLTDERAPPLIQAVYASLATWITAQPLLPPSPPSHQPAPNPTGPFPSPYQPRPPARSHSPHPDRFVQLQGRTYYKSSQGKLWDTAQPPPYPCRICHCLHWNFVPCPSPAAPQTPNWPAGERPPYAPQ